jgi:hypothetical protein
LSLCIPNPTDDGVDGETCRIALVLPQVHVSCTMASWSTTAPSAPLPSQPLNQHLPR